MDAFTEFVYSLDTDELKAGAVSSMIDVNISESEKEHVGAMCFGMILAVLRQYHERFILPSGASPDKQEETV